MEPLKKPPFVIILVLVVGSLLIAFYNQALTPSAKSRRVLATSDADTQSKSLRGGFCDKDCKRFRALMSNDSAWTADRPRSAIVVLIGRRDNAIPRLGIHPGTQMFAAFTRNLDRFFNDYYQYPLIVFYEQMQVNESELARLRALTTSPTFFQPLVFTLPPFINLTDALLERCSLKSQGIGYKHMCRFQAKTIYEHPIMQSEELEYVWRLDDDSFLNRNVTYDPFQYMKEHGIRYGFIRAAYDNPCWTVGLWEAAKEYFDRQGIEQHTRCPHGFYYYNNFELSALSLWRSPEYKEYIEHIDRLGGFFYHRWGDATVKTLAVSRLLHANELHAFRDIGYKHNVN